MTYYFVHQYNKTMLWRRYSWPQLGWEEIKKRGRLLVIDDAEFAYIELFRRDGYTIEQWHDVTDLEKLEKGGFDVIMLDIRGVGSEISKDEGFGVLKHIRKVRPAQFVIAYSASDYDLTQLDFFRLADAVMPKSADYVDFKREVDRLLQQRFSVEYYVDRITKEIGSPSCKRIICKAIRKGNPHILSDKLNRLIEDPDVRSLILDLLQMAISIVSLAYVK